MLKEVERGVTLKETIDFVMEECCACHVPFFMPTYMQKRVRATKEQFYCPNGHAQHYGGDTEAQKLKKELESARQTAAERIEQLRLDNEQLQDKMLDEVSKRVSAEKKLKRVDKGVCPCCNRTFANLGRHMASKHSTK